MAHCINESRLLPILPLLGALFTSVDAAMPNPVRVGVGPLNYEPWFDCADGVCKNDQLFMPILTKELSASMNVEFVYTPFKRNFTPSTFFQRIYTDLAEDEYDVAWGFVIPGADPYNFPMQMFGINTPMITSVPFFTSNFWSLITKKSTEASLFSFLEPFHWSLWLAIIIGLFVMSGAMIAIQMVDPREGSSGHISVKFAITTVYHSWAAVLGGEDYEWMTPSAKMLRLALLFLVLITGATYTANLAAFFTRPTFTLIGPQTVAELKEANACLTYSVNQQALGPYAKTLIWPPDDAPTNLAYRIKWCRDQISSGKAEAVIEADATGQGILLNNCDVMARGADISIMPQQFAFFLRGDNPEFLAKLNLALGQFVASPAYQGLLNTAFSLGRSCSSTTADDDAPQIDFNQMTGFFLIFGIMVGLAVIGAVFSHFSSRCMPKSKDDDAMTDAEMIVSLNGKVDQILANMSSKRDEGGFFDSFVEKEEDEPSAKPSYRGVQTTPSKSTVPSQPEIDLQDHTNNSSWQKAWPAFV